jgi:D-serine deaminase-like pyridoxal phosphate-dependent protein
MTLDDLPTPCLVLDRTILLRNIQTMAQALTRHGVPLRPHIKTAKSIEVARLAVAGQPGGITISALAEAEYFAAQGVSDILYAVGVTRRSWTRSRRSENPGPRSPF